MRSFPNSSGEVKNKKETSQIREYKKEDKNNIIFLLDSPSVKSELWDWQFDSHFLSDCSRPIVAVDKWNQVVGYNGLMPIKLYSSDHGALDAAWTCDFFVRSDVRGLGVGKSIKETLKKQSNIILAMGTSEAASVVLTKAGWWPYAGVFAYSKKTDEFQSVESSLKNVTELDDLPLKCEINELWEGVKKTYAAIVVRDYDYLNWRYRQFPIDNYHYLAYRLDGKLLALCIYRLESSSCVIVDYLGESESAVDKHAFVNWLSNKYCNVSCVCSSSKWSSLLLSNGFSKSINQHNTFVYSSDNKFSPKFDGDIFIMGGDCDGDILQAGIAGGKKKDASLKNELDVKRVGSGAFISIRDDWEKLLCNADQDNIFLSWEWMHTWWSTFSLENNFELCLIEVRKDGRLVAVAPMYMRLYKLYGFTFKQIQFIGCSWSGPYAFRSEYLDFIVDPSFERIARVAIFDFLNEKVEWDEMVLGDIMSSSVTHKLMREYAKSFSLYQRNVHVDHSVSVPLNCSIEEYSKNISANLRRSIINKFEKLVHDNDVVFTCYKDLKGCPFDIFDELNRFHLLRWGKKCFSGSSRRFHEKIVENQGGYHGVYISVLEYKNTIVALAYCLVYKREIYNIQLGFDESKFQKQSIGLIQLGQTLLSAMGDGGFDGFDFLAGRGKQEFYKKRFGGRSIFLTTEQYLKSKFLVWIYRIYDKIKKIKSNSLPR